MYKERCTRECLLEYLECFSGPWSPGQRPGLPFNRLVNGVVMELYESSVEVRKAKEMLELFNSGRYGPVLDALLIDVITKELH